MATERNTNSMDLLVNPPKADVWFESVVLIDSAARTESVDHQTSPSTRLGGKRCFVRALIGGAAMLAVTVSCGSAPSDDNTNTNDNSGTYVQSEDPDAVGTVVPPDQQGVGGGAPIDDLDSDQTQDDVNGDGAPG